MEKHALRALSFKAGCVLLIICVMQIAASAALLLVNTPGTNLLAAISGLTILGGALAGKLLLGNSSREQRHGSVSLPDSLLLIPVGAAICMAGNFAGSFIESVAERAGVTFRGGLTLGTPQSLPGLLLTVLSIGLLPAIAEELLLRACLLPPLRRFGDGFAVLCTAALFALLHQNMAQAPMAFVSGLGLGWIYIRGGRLILPIAVHAWNNTAAVLLSLKSERTANIYALVLGALGLACFLALCLRRPKGLKGGPEPQNSAHRLSPLRRSGYFFFGSVPMVLALAFYVVLIIWNTRA